MAPGAGEGHWFVRSLIIKRKKGRTNHMTSYDRKIKVFTVIGLDSPWTRPGLTLDSPRTRPGLSLDSAWTQLGPKASGKLDDQACRPRSCSKRTENKGFHRDLAQNTRKNKCFNRDLAQDTRKIQVFTVILLKTQRKYWFSP